MSTTASPITIPRPQADEHVAYFGKYIEKVPDGDLISMLREQLMDTVALLKDVSPEKADYAYGPGKWTIKEVVGHLMDTERVMAYRALTFARKDQTNLPSFDENAWVPAANFGARSLGDLLEELQVVRASTIQFAKHLDDETLKRRGKANNNEVSVRALLYIIAGHERHHVALLKEKYL
jgi:uncharacterized damage-inducible protein DinB